MPQRRRTSRASQPAGRGREGVHRSHPRKLTAEVKHPGGKEPAGVRRGIARSWQGVVFVLPFRYSDVPSPPGVAGRTRLATPAAAAAARASVAAQAPERRGAGGVPVFGRTRIVEVPVDCRTARVPDEVPDELPDGGRIRGADGAGVAVGLGVGVLGVEGFGVGVFGLAGRRGRGLGVGGLGVGAGVGVFASGLATQMLEDPWPVGVQTVSPQQRSSSRSQDAPSGKHPGLPGAQTPPQQTVPSQHSGRSSPPHCAHLAPHSHTFAVLMHCPSLQATALQPSAGQSASVSHSTGQHRPLPQQTWPGAQSAKETTQVPLSQMAAVHGSVMPAVQSASVWQTGGPTTTGRQTPLAGSSGSEQLRSGQQPFGLAVQGCPLPEQVVPSQTCCVQAPPIGAQIEQLGLQQNSSAPQTAVPHVSPQNCSVQPPPTGAQMEQLKLQQYSPAPQVTWLHDSPAGSQNSWVQAPPMGAQMEQLSLQQNSPGPQRTWLQGTAPASPQRASEQGVPAGTQMPPQFSQQVVPSRQRMAAQLEVAIGSQVPPHSAQQVVPSRQRTAAHGLVAG